MKNYTKDVLFQLAQNKLMFQQLIDHMSSAVVVYEVKNNGADFIFKEFNCAAEKIEKVDRKDVIGKNVLDVFPTAKKYGILEVFSRVWRTGKGEDFPLKFYEDNRISGWRQNYIYKLATGEIVTIYDDITEKKKAEQALKESELRFKQVSECAGEWIWEVDANGLYTYSNPPVTNIIGYKPEELVGKKYFYDLFVPEEKEKLKKIGMQKFAKKEIFTKFVNTIIHKNGQEVIVETSGLPILDKDDNLLGYRGADIDITAQKVAQQILESQKDNLQQTVVKKIKDLDFMKKEVADAKRLSEIGKLAATVAHELRNPLGVIRAAVYNIKMKSKDEKLNSHLENIDKKIIESDLIIRNLLTYSNIRPPHYEHVHVLKVLNDCIMACKHKYRKADIKVKKVHNLKSKDVVEADPVQLNEIFANLLDNAFQSYTVQRGSVDVVAEYNAKKGWFDIAIKDNGSGIDTQDLVKVFDPFFTKRSKGTGLGLTVCSQIVALHGGKIEIESNKNIGTAVTVKLPIKKTFKGDGNESKSINDRR